MKSPLPADRRLPHPDRLDPARADHALIVRRHEEAMARGEGGYADPATGHFVFTAACLWDRGSCCDSGCRHCPFLERRS